MNASANGSNGFASDGFLSGNMVQLMDGKRSSQPMIDEVELMLANARLRDELEPYRDESIDSTATSRMPLQQENEYLESILAWERAPAIPIAQWFEPELVLPASDELTDQQLGVQLHGVIEKLFSQGIVLSYTDHLSDRQLYHVIARDILPCCEKKLEPTRLGAPRKTLQWRCVEDNETWLAYYADPVERRRFQEEFEVELPAVKEPLYQRKLPGNR
ncbi:MAG: hypothetical protein AAGJ40_11670 [Planctomycetota bacterium]